MLLSELTREDIRRNPYDMFFYCKESDILIFVYEVFTGNVNDDSYTYFIIIPNNDSSFSYSLGASTSEKFNISATYWTKNYEHIYDCIGEFKINKRKLLVDKFI